MENNYLDELDTTSQNQIGSGGIMTRSSVSGKNIQLSTIDYLVICFFLHSAKDKLLSNNHNQWVPKNMDPEGFRSSTKDPKGIRHTVEDPKGIRHTMEDPKGIRHTMEDLSDLSSTLKIFGDLAMMLTNTMTYLNLQGNPLHKLTLQHYGRYFVDCHSTFLRVDDSSPKLCRKVGIPHDNHDPGYYQHLFNLFRIFGYDIEITLNKLIELQLRDKFGNAKVSREDYLELVCLFEASNLTQACECCKSIPCEYFYDVEVDAALQCFNLNPVIISSLDQDDLTEGMKIILNYVNNQLDSEGLRHSVENPGV